MSPGRDGGAWQWSRRWHRCRVRDEGCRDATAAMVEGGGVARRWGLRLIREQSAGRAGGWTTSEVDEEAAGDNYSNSE
jgi:hypothetical protein